MRNLHRSNYVLFASVFLIIYSYAYESDINSAFQQMSRYCFSELDCGKCAKTFHSSSLDITSTIFDHLNFTKGIKNDIADIVDTSSDSLSAKIQANCERLRDSAFPARHVLHTNYSGSGNTQGVFVTTLYTITDDFRKKSSNSRILSSKDHNHQESSTRSRSSDQSWQQYIPEAYRSYPGSKIGSGMEVDKKRTQETQKPDKELRKSFWFPIDSKSHDLALLKDTLLRQPKEPRYMFFIAANLENGGASVVAIPTPISKVEAYNPNNKDPKFPISSGFSKTQSTAMIDEESGNEKIDTHDDMVCINDFCIYVNNSGVGMVAYDGENYFGMNPFMLQKKKDAMPDNKIKSKMISEEQLDTPYGFVISKIVDEVLTVAKNLTSAEKDASFGMVREDLKNLTQSIENELHKVLNQYGKENNYNYKIMKSNDQNKLESGKDYSSVIEHMTNPATKYLYVYTPAAEKASKGSQHTPLQTFLINKSDNSVHMGIPMAHTDISAIMEAANKTSKDIQKAIITKSEMLRHQFMDTIKNIINQFKNIKHKIDEKTNNLETKIKIPSNEFFRFVDLPNGKIAIATPTSFYIETKDRKISRIEELPPFQTETSNSNLLISDKTNENNNLNSMFKKPLNFNSLNSFWNNFTAGVCDALQKDVSKDFKGFTDYFNYRNLAHEAFDKISVDHSISMTPEEFRNIFNSYEDEPKNIQKSCEMAKAFGVFNNSIPSLSRIYYNPTTGHGLVDVKFPIKKIDHNFPIKYIPSLNFPNNDFSAIDNVSESAAEDAAKEIMQQFLQPLQKKNPTEKTEKKSDIELVSQNHFEELIKAMQHVLEDMKKKTLNFTDVGTQDSLNVYEANNKENKKENEKALTFIASSKSSGEAQSKRLLTEYNEDIIGRKILSYFKIDQDTKLEKIINFQPIEHANADLLADLQSQDEFDESSFSLVALTIYLAVGIAVIAAWFWIAREKQIKEGLLNPMQVDVNTEYFKLQDI